MKKYHFITAFKISDKNNSGFKLRYDNRQILKDIGYIDCTYYFKAGKDKIIDELYFYLSFIKLLFKRKGDIIVMQYPLASSSLFNYLLKACKRKGIKIVCIVIDIESIRTKHKKTTLINKEVASLNQFSSLIVHNKNMVQWLSQNGCVVPLTSIELFDYLCKDTNNTVNATNITTAPFTRIAFAGNLQKSKFIRNIPFSTQATFLLYGYLKKQFTTTASNVVWMGEFKPEELLNKIQGHWGLIWDGEETNFLDEGLGNYIYYNTPHKTSLYIVCGLPVIVPANAAIASYILEKKLGITINKIEDCFHLTVSPDEYKILKENVLKMREQLSQGYFLQTALQKVLASI